MPIDRSRSLRGAVAGAIAAGVWAAQQPLDKRCFASRYDDVELLGRFITGERSGWYLPGLLLHLQNGAAFGAVYAQVAPRLPSPAATRGIAVALAEHVALWPLSRLSDRYHPGRSALPPLAGNRRAFWLAVWRHVLFGAILGMVEARLNGPQQRHGPADAATVSKA